MIINLSQTTTPHATTVLRPFFRDHPDASVPGTLWCKGRLTEADTLTIRLGATPSGPTSAHLYRPPIFSTYLRLDWKQSCFTECRCYIFLVGYFSRGFHSVSLRSSTHSNSISRTAFVWLMVLVCIWGSGSSLMCERTCFISHWKVACEIVYSCGRGVISGFPFIGPRHKRLQQVVSKHWCC